MESTGHYGRPLPRTSSFTERVDLRTGEFHRAGNRSRRKFLSGVLREKEPDILGHRLSFEGLKDRAVFLFGQVSLSRALYPIDAGRHLIDCVCEKK